MKPRVSVIMPTYNQGGFLSDALAALEAQTFTDFELIVVNDGSTDDTEEILDLWRSERDFQVIRQANAGAAQAINAGIALARGDWWTWVSSDNEQYRDWLDRLVRTVLSDPSIGAAFSDYDREEGGRRFPERPGRDPRPGYKLGQLIETLNCFFGPSFLISKEVWRAAGPHLGKISHDYGHWLRVEEACMVSGKTIAFVPRRLCVYKAHPARATVVKKHEFDAEDHRQRSLARRRAGVGICLREVV